MPIENDMYRDSRRDSSGTLRDTFSQVIEFKGLASRTVGGTVNRDRKRDRVGHLASPAVNLLMTRDLQGGTESGTEWDRSGTHRGALYRAPCVRSVRHGEAEWGPS
jgi:hypothetical protein